MRKERDYARVMMIVPADPWIGDLLDVSGHIIPDPTGVVQYWVAYHIAVAFPESEEWLAAGYYTDEVNGTLFYIEWWLGDTPGEDTTWPVTFGEQYRVSVNWGDLGGVNPGAGWGAHIWDSDENLLIERHFPDLPLTGINIWCYAGGESN
jgi:hypothetical protein